MNDEGTAVVDDDDDIDPKRRCSYQEAVAADLRTFRRDLGEHGLLSALKRLEQPSSARTALAIAEDWILIFAAWAACAFGSIYLAPVAVLILGNRQRSLGNILHDGSHYSLDARAARNDRWLTWLLAPALFNVTARYRGAHRDHHRHLGSPALDPDFIHDEACARMRWPRILERNVLSWPTWWGSFTGHLGRATWAERVKILAWWAALLGLLALAASPRASLVFAALWMSARATVFHVITTFREITDHAGRVPGSLVGFTRNGPPRGLARHFFHPRNNGYHLLHHLDPRLPFHALPEAHALAMRLPAYAAAHHCDGYFLGKHPVVTCWERGCSAEDRSPGQRGER